MPFDKQPTLIGRHVGVRPLQPSDYGALYAVAADPLIWTQHPAQNRHEESVFQQLFEESLASGGTLVVTDLVSGSIIGSSRYHGYSEAQSEIEIGWTFLARSYWGGKYNGDLKSIMVRHAFRFVESIVLRIDRGNMRSRRAAENIGAVAEPGLDQNGRMTYRLSRRLWTG